MHSCGSLNINEQRLDDQLKPIYNSSVPIQDVAWRIWRERLTIETGGERGLGKSVLAARHDDDDDDFDDDIALQTNDYNQMKKSDLKMIAIKRRKCK